MTFHRFILSLTIAKIHIGILITADAVTMKLKIKLVINRRAEEQL